MIKSYFGAVEIKGTRAEIYAEFCTIIFSLYNDDVLTKEEIEMALEKSLITREEANKELEQKAQGLLDKLKMKLDEME